MVGSNSEVERDSCLMTVVVFSPYIVANRQATLLVSSEEQGCVIRSAYRYIFIRWDLLGSIQEKLCEPYTSVGYMFNCMCSQKNSF